MTDDGLMEDEGAVELASIQAIFPELVVDSECSRNATLQLEVTPAYPLQIKFSDLNAAHVNEHGEPSRDFVTPEVRTSPLAHLPSIRLHVELPKGYPDCEPPIFHLDTDLAWLPHTELPRLELAGKKLWEDYGRSQVVFAYIDFLQTEIEHGFAFEDGSLMLDVSLEQPLRAHDKKTRRDKFNEKTYDCGVCLYPKRGSACYQLQHCGHIFCVECLRDFYNNAITEGDVGAIKCLDPDCGKRLKGARNKKKRTLHPTELLEIPLEEDQVRRFVKLKLKKMIESDKCTIYCPRSWCQAPARSAKYAKFDTKDLASWPESDDEEEAEQAGQPDTQPEPTSNANTQRLTICSNEKCNLAFCNVCNRGWHGDYMNCLPTDNSDRTTAEEQASYDYIRLHTSPCPTCNSACQKIMGCNHMICYQCNTHYCYLCSSWLPEADPYRHFNTRDMPCFQRLWDLEGGDEGNGDQVFAGPRAAEALAVAAARQDAIPPPEDVAPAPVLVEAVPPPAAPQIQGRARARAARRAQAPRAPQGPPQMQVDDFNRQGLVRFLELAANDEEEGWDSDELDLAEQMEQVMGVGGAAWS